MCVQDIDVQCVLQFTLIHAAGCALHRLASRVIHRSEFLFLTFDRSSPGNIGSGGQGRHAPLISFANNSDKRHVMRSGRPFSRVGGSLVQARTPIGDGLFEPRRVSSPRRKLLACAGPGTQTKMRIEFHIPYGPRPTHPPFEGAGPWVVRGRHSWPTPRQPANQIASRSC